MLLQQQLQEVRGEIKAAVTNDARQNGITPKRLARGRSTVNGSSVVEPEVMSDQHVITSKPAPHVEAHGPSPSYRPKVTNPLASEVASVAVSKPADSPERKVEQVVVSKETPALTVTARSNSADIATAPLLGRSPEHAPVPVTPPAVVPSRDLTQTTHAPFIGVTSKEPESATVLMSDEDIVIFEQLRHQLIVWLRVEAVRSGVDIAGKDPAELLEVLQRLDGYDETQLQVVSTLLELSDQIIAVGHASLLEYKQAMMFYLMHSRPSR
jgi:hypothetical protein